MKYCPKFRAFNDVSEMNEKLIELWNAVVGPEDTVYDLGDFAFCNKLKDLKSVARRLNGSHVLILGNHDTLISQNKEALLRELKDDGNPIFSDILHYKELNFDGGAGAIKDGKTGMSICMFHYPVEEHNRASKGSFMLHGHLHDRASSLEGRILNVGFDSHGKILSLDEIVQILGQKQISTRYFWSWLNTDSRSIDLSVAYRNILQKHPHNTRIGKALGEKRLNLPCLFWLGWGQIRLNFDFIHKYEVKFEKWQS